MGIDQGGECRRDGRRELLKVGDNAREHFILPTPCAALLNLAKHPDLGEHVW
jgi:hypothetical protein